MEAAGADPGIINLHQGRGQTGVLYKNYVTDMDRAVKLRRAYVDRMFGEERGEWWSLKRKRKFNQKTSW